MRFLERLWWLRVGAIWFHLSLFLRVRLELLPILIRVTQRKISSEEAYRLAVTKFLARAAEMERRPLPAKDAHMRPYRLWLRFGHYAMITWFVTVIPEEMRGRLPVEVAKQVVHYCELAIDLYRSGAKDYVAERSIRSKRTPPVVRQSRAVASLYKLLASTYLELHPNDAAYDCATAFKHLRRGAEYLELEGVIHPQVRWDAAGMWCELGKSYLAHPYEPDSLENARKVLLRARELVVRDIGTLKPPPVPMIYPGDSRTTPGSMSTRSSLEYLREVLESRKRVRAGHVDPSYSWWEVAPLMYRINCQLGAVYRKQGNLAASIECFTAALTDFTQDGDKSAYINCEIGYTYLECGRSSNKGDLNLAISHFDKVIELQGKTKFIKPLIRALIGNAYAIVGLTEIAVDTERTKMMPRLDVMAKNLHIAMREARKKERTDLCQEAAYVLGLVHMNKREYAPAYKAFALSSRLLDRLQRSSRTVRLKWYRIGTTSSLYNNLLFTAVRYKRTRKPEMKLSEFAAENIALRRLFTFSECSRAVFLQEEMVNRAILPRGGNAEAMSAFLASRRAWHQAEIDLQTRDTTLADERAVTGLRKKRDDLEDEHFKALAEIRVKYNDPQYDPDMPVAPAHFYEIQKVVNSLAKVKTTVLVQYHMSNSRIYMVMLTPRVPRFRNRIYWKELALDFEVVTEMIGGGTNAVTQDGNVRNWWQWGKSRLPQTLERLGALAEYPARIVAQWEQSTGARVERLILVPHKLLHSIPLHAIRLPSGEIWGDTIAIRYVPSASVLCRLVHDARGEAAVERKSGTPKAVAIAGLSNNHSFEREAESVSQILGGSILRGTERSITEIIEDIMDADYIHFSCHGSYDHSSPMLSGLDFVRNDDPNKNQEALEEELTRPARLTLGEIFERTHLNRAPIVVLSACESGISKIEQSRDEYIGLPAGFLYAGAKTVVSSLWPVDDPATYLLMTRLVRQFAQSTDISEALKIAQQWLRALSKDDAMNEVATMLRDNARLPEKRSVPDSHEMDNVLKNFPVFRIAGVLPFAEPYWWAGFTINGLG
ncbi:MAG TPA: CHAT domain-containing protein [Terracidiphilus sp.]|nr:CHAT domain-containing protein [Terracidiphilus sp.]